jgi:adenosine deaminase
MLNEGLNVSINSDDPPLFGTTLCAEYLKIAAEFEMDEDTVYSFAQNAHRAKFG